MKQDDSEGKRVSVAKLMEDLKTWDEPRLWVGVALVHSQHAIGALSRPGTFA